MTKKIGDKKIASIKSTDVKSTEAADSVKGTGSVGAVSAVKQTGGVSASAAATGSTAKRRATVVMSYAEREQLFQMVTEEASKLFAGSKMSGEKQKIVADAVKMAIDSGLLASSDAAGKQEDSASTAGKKKI